MSSLELKVPPPLVALLFGLLMWLASRLVAPVDVDSRVRVVLPIAIACIGFAVGLMAMVSFRRARFQITPEERTLSALFDPEYAAYRARVRRWL